MKRSFFTVSLVFMSIFILVLPSAIAEINSKNASVMKVYGPGQPLNGQFSLRVRDENADSEVRISLTKGGWEDLKTFSLLEFLNISEAEFSCSHADCGSVYNASNPQAEKRIIGGIEAKEGYAGLSLFQESF